ISYNPETLAKVVRVSRMSRYLWIGGAILHHCKYTWNDRQDARICFRIDCTFIYGDWIDNVVGCIAVFLPEE
ncbi:hypothetical protein HAX54_031148, partial [Datura stramonium]|nr:hypothetical protein [Datura stramonium]